MILHEKRHFLKSEVEQRRSLWEKVASEASQKWVTKKIYHTKTYLTFIEASMKSSEKKS
jgi:hypothetical protein